MSNKWSVTIHQSHHNGSKNPKCRWVVDPPGYNHKNRNWGDYRWHVAGGKWFAWGSGTSKREAWEQALAYADQQARTQEIVLPRVNGSTPIDENDLDITVFDFDGSVCISQPQLGRSGREQIITIHTEFAEEVALALLAHAERMGK
ncbi:hypothetical protein ACL1CN_10375 [Corynebacterium striatum]|nr:hypothetical protein [Corynebacterium striatum]HCG2985199.1 hypothetical protein [Corynebacterium striatum]HCG3001021.1 hypothetical protein [Corynebacterium striatum]HCG3016912.1 hypothetical protein [Corynebacterium striatum]HCG3143543.1 hypothetical protein [Corynebacterium striatum]